MKKILFLFTITTLFSCKHKVDEQELIEQNLTVEETLEAILSEDYITTLGIDENGRELLYSFYEKRNFKPLWSSKKQLDTIGSQLKNLLQFPIRYGMTSKRFDLKWGHENPIQDEIVMVCGLARSYSDLHYGMFDSTLSKLKSPRYIAIESLDTLLDFSSGNISTKIIAWGPSDTTYQYLANGLFQFVENNPVHEPKILLKTIHEDSTAAIQGTKEILIRKKYLDTSNVNDSLTFILALKKFQRENGCNPDGKIGANTVQILTETNMHKAQRIALAMEKQRRKKPYPKRYFQINIPEFYLRLHNEDTLCSENRIVVGKYENQTPELTSNLYAIDVYPYWNVPYSIASKEILPAAKRNSNYFKRNDMVLLKKGDTINPKNVNWSKITEKSFPYKVVQQPGYKNSLGILKFNFYNKYDVYFHDTPSKSLFNTVSRSYSHGCMRTENPIDLAKIVLELDENTMTPDSLDTLISRTGQNFQLRLKKRIPIFVEYNSVIIQEKQVVILRDLYLHDEKYLTALFGDKNV